MIEAEQHLLVCLAEECAEIGEQAMRVAVRVSKMIRFGADEVQPGQLRSNVERIADELTDLLAVAEMLEEAGVLRREKVERKKLKVGYFMEYARQCGALAP